MHKQFLGMACLFLVASWVVAPEAGAVGMGEGLKELDLNGDGDVGKDEAAQALKSRYAGMDVNKDGVVNEQEFVNDNLDRLKALDTNGDGKITREETRASLRARFAR